MMRKKDEHTLIDQKCQILRRNLIQLKQHIKKTSEGRKTEEIEYKKRGLDEKFKDNIYGGAK